MLKRKQLRNRTYEGSFCTGFILTAGDIEAEFKRNMGNSAGFEWSIRVLFDRTRDTDTQVYLFRYVMPVFDVSLELVAATGLRFLQMYLKEEVQMKSTLEMTIGQMIEGM